MLIDDCAYPTRWWLFGSFQTPDQVVESDEKFFLVRKTLLYSGMKSYFHLNQLQWLGFDYNQRDDIEAIKAFVEYTIKRSGQQATDRIHMIAFQH